MASALVGVSLFVGCGNNDSTSTPAHDGAKNERARDASTARPAGPNRGAAAQVAPRNLLFISIDTLRADALGAYGGKRRATPFIDALAARSILFESAWTHSPKTAPAHMSMFTGLPPSVHGVGNLNTSGAQRLPESIRTLSEVLQDAGFQTGGFTGGGNAKGSLGFDRGFDHFDDLGEPLDKKLEKVEPWIRAVQKNGQPWYCFLHTYHVHDPYMPVEAYAKRFVSPDYNGKILRTRSAIQRAIDSGDDLVPHMKGFEKITWNYWFRADEKDPADLAYLHDLYIAGVAHMDSLIGEFMTRLERSGALDGTLVVFTTDHGEEFGEHGMVRHDQLWVENAHVPLLVMLPGARGAGTRIPEAVRHIDLTPSVLELLGVEDQGMTRLGVSWASWLEPGAPRGAPRTVIGEHQSRRESPLDTFSLREEHLLLMDRVGVVELFDRRHDPRERRALNWPKVQQRLDDLLREQQRHLAVLGESVGAGGEIEMTPELRAELEALGYIGGDDD